MFETFQNDNDKTFTRFIVYNKKFKYDTLDLTFGKQFAKQLGDFYFCASDNWRSHSRRIVILVSNDNNSCEIYAQMCNLDLIIKNIKKLFKVIDKLQDLILQLDSNLRLQIQIYKE